MSYENWLKESLGQVEWFAGTCGFVVTLLGCSQFLVTDNTQIPKNDKPFSWDRSPRSNCAYTPPQPYCMPSEYLSCVIHLFPGVYILSLDQYPGDTLVNQRQYQVFFL